MKNKILTIIGNVAAGKSSAMDIVTKAVDGEAVYADDLFQTSDPFRELFLKDLPRWALANETWLTLKRAQMLKEAVKRQKCNWLVVDSGLLMSWVYTYSHFLVGKISQAEWELYRELYNELTGKLYKNLQVVYLDYSLDTLMYRLKLRGRDYELKYYTWDYLSQLQMGLKMLIAELEEKKIPIIHIKETEVPEFVVNKDGMSKLKNIIINIK